jgi:hypothetical protein
VLFPAPSIPEKLTILGLRVVDTAAGFSISLVTVFTV